MSKSPRKPLECCKHCSDQDRCPVLNPISKVTATCFEYEIYRLEESYTNPEQHVARDWIKTAYELDPHLYLGEESDIIDKLYSKYISESKIQFKKEYRRALDCVLANLVTAGKLNRPLIKPTSYSENKYIYSWFKGSIIENCLLFLAKDGYLIYWNKTYHKFDLYYPTSKLLSKNLETKVIKPEQFVYMTKKNKKCKQRIRTKPLMNKTYERMTEELKLINSVLGEVDIRFQYIPAVHKRPGFSQNLELMLKCGHIIWEHDYTYLINKNKVYLIRVFTRGSYRYGGRFYTPIFQGIPSNVRSTITIDKEETVELDYSAHHIRLLYHKKGIDFKGEPYVYPKTDEKNKCKRQIHKMIAMIAINAKSRKQSIMATYQALKEDKGKEKFNTEVPGYKELEEYFDDFLEYHKEISDCVCADKGVILQRLDSRIMKRVLLSLTSEGIVALPVHDSLIVQKKYEDKLRQTMIQCYKQVTGFEPVIG